MTELERIARYLCLCDGHGPDEMVVAQPMPIGVKGLPIINDQQPVASWTLYINYVQLVVTCLRDTGSDEVKAAMDDVLSGAAKFEPEPEPESETDPPPYPLPDWRDRYNLRSVISPGRAGLIPK